MHLDDVEEGGRVCGMHGLGGDAQLGGGGSTDYGGHAEKVGVGRGEPRRDLLLEEAADALRCRLEVANGGLAGHARKFGRAEGVLAALDGLPKVALRHKVLSAAAVADTGRGSGLHQVNE